MSVMTQIKRLCKEYHTSVSRLEKELGFANKSLYERKGETLNIRSDRLLKIADYFGVTTDWLLKGFDANYQHFTSEEIDIIRQFERMSDEYKKEFVSYGEYLVRKTSDEADRGKKVSANKRMEEEA